MRKVIAAAALLALGAGCSNGGSDDIGGLRANLTLPSGTVINTINYSITGGPAAVTENGAASVAHSASAQFRVGNLPAGGGYNIALAATTVAGATCAGSGTFSITANTFTGVTMTLFCGNGVSVDTNGDGDLQVDISVLEQALTCPVAGGITALPTEVYVGFDIALQGFTTGSIGATPTQTAATYGWSGPGGTFSAATALSTNYTCVTAGDHTINLTVSKQGCADSVMPVILTCTGAPTTGGTAGVGGTGGTAGDAGTGGTAGTAGVGGTGGTGGTGGAGGTGGTGGAPATGFQLLSAACRACAQNNYTMDIAGEDVYGKCFGTVETPSFAQACVDAFVCSTLADDGAPGRGDDCGQNDINGAITCYCGQPYNEANCTNDSIGPQGECQDAWEIATNCDAIVDVSDRANCVLNNFSDFAVPAGIASYGVVLQQGSCAAECLSDYNGFTGTYPTEL